MGETNFTDFPREHDFGQGPHASNSQKSLEDCALNIYICIIEMN